MGRLVPADMFVQMRVIEKPDKRDHLTKCPRAETRTNCQVRMGLIMDKKKENYKVIDLFLEHNHTLQLPQTSHLLASQRKISELQGFEIETADDVGIGPKAAHELACIQVGGSVNLSYTLQDHKNYLRGKRQREMAYGQAGSMLMYFQKKNCREPINSICTADGSGRTDCKHVLG